MFYYTFTTFDCNFIPRNAEICKVSSETKNVGKAHKYRLNRHLPTYEKIIKNLYSFSLKICASFLLYSIRKELPVAAPRRVWVEKCKGVVSLNFGLIILLHLE